METNSRYELQLQCYIRDRDSSGSGTLQFQQTKEIRANSFEDMARIMKAVHTLLESLK